MDVGLLGPLEVRRDGRTVVVGASKQRALLAVLALHANEVVSTDRLIDELWGEAAPETAAHAVRVYVSGLRKVLGRDAPLVTKPSGYALELGRGELDLHLFEQRVANAHDARARGDVEAAASLLREALGLWRGPALADFSYEPFAQTEIVRLEECRLAALEDRFEAELDLGCDADVVGDLKNLVRAHPLRERLRRQLMLALYRSGRQPEALAAYREARRTLVDEFGIEPSRALRELEAAILRQDPSLAPDSRELAAVHGPDRVLPSAPRPIEGRRVVSVLFCGVAEHAVAERLDAEVLRRVLTGVLEMATQAIERHGGRVEATTGGVKAVFGLPRVHEDDALRALRAAVDIRAGVAALEDELVQRCGVRIGVDSGEVVAGDGTDVIGGAVNTAARLGQRAAAGEILLGETTRRLVANAVRVEPLEALAAWRLVELLPGAPAFARRLDAPLVGREVELAHLRQAFARVVREQTLVLCTVFGVAGIGKSRLAGELLASVSDEAQAFVGRCLAYGDGISFWPLREVLKQAGGDDTRDDVLALVEGAEDAPLIAGRIAIALGAPGTTASPDEIFSAFRRLFETLARRRPLVLVFEDIHWAEPTFLDFLDHLAERARTAPILLLCLARPELLEERPTWGAGKVNAISLSLEPLDDAETDRLIGNLFAGSALPPPVQGRIKRVAEGNPLFVEQMLALVADGTGAGDEHVIPPSIQALLAARVDRLGPGERAVLERAAVVGREFWQGAVEHLLPKHATATAKRHLDALVKKELIRPDHSFLPSERAYSFRHVLIQDAAYRAITKQLRSDLHERAAEWLQRDAGRRAMEEVLGYHLEQAVNLRNELGVDDEGKRALGARAGSYLAAAGRRARVRYDVPAALNLLDRATRLLPVNAWPRIELLFDLSDALLYGGDIARSEEILREAVTAALRSNDPARSNRARLEAAFRNPLLGHDHADEARFAKEAIKALEDAGDDRGLLLAWRAISNAGLIHGRLGDSGDAAERALVYARRLGDGWQETDSIAVVCIALVWGPLPIPEAIIRAERYLAEAEQNPSIEAPVGVYLGLLYALAGRQADARRMYERGLGIGETMGVALPLVLSRCQVGAGLAMLEGDPAAAERELRDAIETLAAMGGEAYLPWTKLRLAEALYAQEHDDDAVVLALDAERTANEADVEVQSLARSLRAKAMARDGEFEDAERLACEAIDLLEPTDLVWYQAEAEAALADVLHLAERGHDAAVAAQEALRLYDQKGIVVPARQLRAMLTQGRV